MLMAVRENVFFMLASHLSHRLSLSFHSDLYLVRRVRHFSCGVSQLPEVFGNIENI